MRIARRAAGLVLCGATLLVSAPPARRADTDHRSVTGVVTDGRGNALPGASVRIEDTRSLAIASYITQRDGRYYFHQLSPDLDYTLAAKYKRWWSKTKTLSKFNEKKEATVDLEIPID